MAVVAYPYGKFWIGLGTAQFNLPVDVIKVLLTTAAYTPNVDTHEFLSDVTNEVLAVGGSGYTAGGKTLTNVSLTYDAPNRRAVLNADTLVWSGANFTAHRAVVYKSTGTAATSRLIGYIDFGIDKVYSNEDFELNFSSGVLRFRGPA